MTERDKERFAPLDVWIPVPDGSDLERALARLATGIAAADEGTRRIRSIRVERNMRGPMWRWNANRKRDRRGYAWDGLLSVDTDWKFPTQTRVHTGSTNPTVEERVEARVLGTEDKLWWKYTTETVELSSLADLVVIGVGTVAWYCLRKEKKVPTEGKKVSYPMAYRKGIVALRNWREKKEGGLWD